MFSGLEISASKSRKIVNNCRKMKMPQKGFKNTDLLSVTTFNMKNHQKIKFSLKNFWNWFSVWFKWLFGGFLMGFRRQSVKIGLPGVSDLKVMYYKKSNKLKKELTIVYFQRISHPFIAPTLYHECIFILDTIFKKKIT